MAVSVKLTLQDMVKCAMSLLSRKKHKSQRKIQSSHEPGIDPCGTS